MTSSESEEQVPRKRTRTSHSDEDRTAAGKKARGRPRVDTQDATAADRRRTQIRLAQRAYRQRKETTIASLKNQSSQLHSIIEQMNKTFGRLNEAVQASGLLQLTPELAREFKNASETFCGLVKTANEGENDGAEEHADPTDNATESHEERVQQKTADDSQHMSWGDSVSFSSSKPESLDQRRPIDSFADVNSTFGDDIITSNLVRHRRSVIGEILNQQSVALPQRQRSQTSSHSQQLPFGLLDLINQDQASYTPSCTADISLSTKTSSDTKTTYSFHEINFARRLTRRALEAGFQLLSTANVGPAVLNYVFKLSLPFLTPEQLRARFKLMLERGPDEDLDWWETPFIQLGGAGTHYPRRDAKGRIAPFKNAWKVRPPGPQDKKSAQVENAIDGRIESLEGVDLTGYEGEWFDAYDVQGYLEEKYACKLDPDSSFAECLLEDDDSKNDPDQIAQSAQFDANPRREAHDDGSPGLTNSSANSSTSSTSCTAVSLQISPQDLPGSGHFGLDMNFPQETRPAFRGEDMDKLVGYDISFDQTLGLDLAPGFDYGFSNESGMHISSTGLTSDMMSNNMASVPVSRQKRKKIVTLDVSRLIDEMMKTGVCLGRAPGFRRKDVDGAVRLAAIPTY
ncbi:hypothetical protein IAQ61_001026 [Plenodomus lingam]|uniref:uncharacterized protein n=1 Tax=Leptosphaeria maculans TaxID=5022 RepID=UPI003317DC0A|nr:hypothetical protein IAQ61_001026 [Plenodomus lingam]